jgi:gluconokinase
MNHNGYDDSSINTSTSTTTSADISSIILAIDVGSSSVRCTAYQCYGTNTDPMEGCSSSIQRQGVEPITGTIRTNGLFEAVDSAVDEVLSKLRRIVGLEDGGETTIKVEAVGFSTFVMNLIAVNDDGELISFNQQNAGNAEDDTNTTTVGISYACNTPEVQAECQRLRQELGPDALDKLYQATGAPLHSAYALPQLRVLYNNGQNNNNNNNNKPYRWQSIAGYCLSRWTNRKHLPMSYSEASWTGLLNVRDCVFEESAIWLLPPSCRAALPELADFTEYVHGIPQFIIDNENDKKNENDKTGTTINPYWIKFPDLRETKFFLGIGDGACANVGSKCTTSSRIAVTVGTSAAVRMCLRHQASSSASSPSNDLPFRIPECRGLFCYRIDRNHVLVGGALTDGGSIVEWASRFLNLEKDESAFQRCLEETKKLVEAEYEYELEEEQTANRHTHRNLIMAPFLSGERSIGFRDGAAGALFGFTHETTPAHFFKSCLESVSLRLKAVIDLMLVVVDSKISLEDRDNNLEDENADKTDNDNNNTSSLPVMVASGKAMEVNHLWRQMIADSSGLRVVLDKDTTEGTSRGVALLVAKSILAEKAAAFASTAGFDNDRTIKSRKQNSLALAQHEEELHPFLTSEPRSTATNMYARKSRLQERFINSISPFFSSS